MNGEWKMYIQLALDRMDINQAIQITQQVEEYIDWIEVGTSLIKEFGIKSIEAIKRAFPGKMIVADTKTMDNAVYECNLCFEAGAGVMTVMGVAPLMTVEACLKEASIRGKKVMIDLLNTNESVRQQLLQYKEAIFCIHVSKDEQEFAQQHKNFNFAHFHRPTGCNLAVAGGISAATMKQIQPLHPSIVIIGSAITRAEHPERAARELRQLVRNRGIDDASN
jgi:3-hexulose-6-phosphate synthase